MSRVLSNYEQLLEQMEQPRVKLPEGAYVAVINNVYGFEDYIELKFDIAEGKYFHFFEDDFEKYGRYKGKCKIWIPKEDGSEQDKWTLKTYFNWIMAFQKSNIGYKWDFDEYKLIGKSIGLVFRKAGNIIDGKRVTYTEVAFPVDVATVRSGKAPTAKMKCYNGYTDDPLDTIPY